MVLTKDELIGSLQNEVRVLLHLASKVRSADLDFRPTPKQRSTLELLQYLTIMAPIHLRGVLAPSFDLDTWRDMWQTGQSTARALSLEETIEAIGKQQALVAELLTGLSDEDLRAEIEMFGMKASRGSMLVTLVLSHYAAYRMQLFLYLKSCGNEQLNTLNLWVGRDNL